MMQANELQATVLACTVRAGLGDTKPNAPDTRVISKGWCKLALADRLKRSPRFIRLNFLLMNDHPLGQRWFAWLGRSLTRPIVCKCGKCQFELAVRASL